MFRLQNIFLIDSRATNTILDYSFKLNNTVISTISDKFQIYFVIGIRFTKFAQCNKENLIKDFYNEICRINGR